MNKTIKTIAIVFLILGALALIGGAVYGWIGRPGSARAMPTQNRQNLPQPGNGWDSRVQRDGMRFFTRQGLFGLPLWLMGGGLTFLIAGTVLMIFNKKITSAVDATPEKEEKKAATPKKAAQSEKSAGKKPASKK